MIRRACRELIERILQLPDCDERARFEAALVGGGGGDLLRQARTRSGGAAGWDDPPPGATPLHVMSMANSRATLALHSGETERARSCCAPACRRQAGSRRCACRWRSRHDRRDSVISGTAARCGPRPSCNRRIATAEREMGRRSVVAAMFAGALSAVTYLRGDVDAALALLADRLDVIERARHAGPDRARLSRHRGELDISRRGRARDGGARIAARTGRGASHAATRVQLADGAGPGARVQQSRIATAADRLADAVGDARGVRSPGVPAVPADLFDRRLAVAAAMGLSLAWRSGRSGGGALAERGSSLRAGPGPQPATASARALQALALHQLGRPGAREPLSEVLSLAEPGRHAMVRREMRILVSRGDRPRGCGRDASAGGRGSAAGRAGRRSRQTVRRRRRDQRAAHAQGGVASCRCSRRAWPTRKSPAPWTSASRR